MIVVVLGTGGVAGEGRRIRDPGNGGVDRKGVGEFWGMTSRAPEHWGCREQRPSEEHVEGVVRRAVEEEVGVGVRVGAVAGGACDATVLWRVPLRMQKPQVHDAAVGEGGHLGAVERRTEDVGGPAGVHMGMPGRDLRLYGGIVRRVSGSGRAEEDRATPEGHDTALEQRAKGAVNGRADSSPWFARESAWALRRARSDRSRESC